MKHTRLATLIILLCGYAASAQIKSDAGRRLQQVEVEIGLMQTAIRETRDIIQALLTRYTPEYKGIVEQKARLAEMETGLASLLIERRELLTQNLLINLPDTNVELLKIIVAQNDRIISLLEKLAKESPSQYPIPKPANVKKRK